MRKFLTKILSVVLAVAMLFSFAACTDGSDKDADNGGSDTPSAATKSLLDTVDALQTDEYADSSLTDTVYGLSEESKVGVIKGDFNKVMYHIPEDDAFQGEVLNWEDYSFEGNDFEKLKSIINYVKEKNNGKTPVKVKLNMPANATIDLDTATAESGHFALVPENLNGFYLQGNGCTFNLQYKDLEWRGFLYFTDCEDVWLENFTIDYEVPSAISGKIVSCDSEKLTVTIDVFPEFNELINRLKTNNGTIWSYLEYNKFTKIPEQGGNAVASSENFYDYTITGTAETGYQMSIRFADSVKSSFQTSKTGNYVHVAFSYYVYNCLTFADCGTVNVENVTMHYSPSMGIVGNNNEHLNINRFKVVRKEGSELLLTTAADSLHLVQQHGTINVTNNIIEYSQDDAYNVKAGFWYEFSEPDILNKQITITKKTQAIPTPRAGDVIEVYNKETFERKATLTVVSVTGDGQRYVIKVKESLVKLNIGTDEICMAGNVSSAKLTFKNNIIRNKRNRGILIQLHDAVVENNTFLNLAHGSIMVLGFMDSFNEAVVPRNVTIRNNKLINNNYMVSPQGDILVSAISSTNQIAPAHTIREIYIENNFISRNGAAGICFRGVGDAKINDNLFYNNSRVSIDKECAIDLTNSSDVEIKGNYCYNSLYDDFQGIIPSGTTNVDSITVADNTDLEISYGKFERASVNVSKLATGSITVDGDLTEWANIGTTVDIVGKSKADSTKATDSEYQEHFEVRTAKLAWDDNGIYIAFDIRDDELVFTKKENFWYGDCFELMMTSVSSMPDADMSLYKNQGECLQLVCVPSWKNGYELISDRTSDTIMANGDQLQVSVKYTDNNDGYCGEIFLPFSVFPTVKSLIDNGDEITFNMVFADAERTGISRIQIANVPHWVETTKKQTAKSPKYYFVED